LTKPYSSGARPDGSPFPEGAQFPVFHRYRDLLPGMPILEAETAQLGRGKAEYASRHVCGRDIIIVRLQLSPRLAGHVVLDPDWIALMAPLSWHGDYVFNGLSARPGDVFLSAGRDGYASTGEGRDTIVIGARRTRIEAACRALAGGPVDAIALADQRLQLHAEIGCQLQRRLLQVIEAASIAPLGGGRLALSEAAEADLVSDLAGMLLPGALPGAARDPGRLEALRIVRAAKSAAMAGPASLSDLCAAGGVGQAWLHRSFVDILGTSPINYLRACRLTAAHDRLLDQSAPPASVKDVALSLGFAKSGRFAAAYRALFAENPSDTFLAKGRRVARRQS
jgi:AraC-like DNA-binding protein